MLRPLPRMCLLLVLAYLAGQACADIAPYLDVLDMDRVWADLRFSHLTGAGQGIAFIDTGIDPNQQAFGGRVVYGLGYVAPSRDPSWSDANGHGTRVAGLAAGAARQVRIDDTPFDVSGLAPEADLIALRALQDSGRGSMYTASSALYWLIFNAPKYDIGVVNMSFGSDLTYTNVANYNDQNIAGVMSQRIETLREMGVLVIASAGNAGSPTGVSFPAVLDNVASVGATTVDDELAYFTNRGPLVDLLAPGMGLQTADLDVSATGPHNAAATVNGTSFSAGEVSGAAALVRQLYFERTGEFPTPDELLSILVDTGEPLTFSGREYRRLDVYAALDYTYSIPEPTTLTILLVAAGVLLRRRSA